MPKAEGSKPNLDALWDDDQVAGLVWRPEERAVVDVLARGAILACKPIPWGSNYSFAVGIGTGDQPDTLAIYKPRSGESPLRDFPPHTLYRRECAAFILSRLLGWSFVPPTVIREGPHGIGSVQLYVEHNPRVHFARFKDQHLEELRVFAAFDLVANNADRKSIHVLKGQDGKLWGIDHGLTFNVWPKLRTVIWDVCGQPIPSDLIAALRRFCDDPAIRRATDLTLGRLLAQAEMDALYQRIERVLRDPCYPMLDPYRNVPFEWF